MTVRLVNYADLDTRDMVAELRMRGLPAAEMAMNAYASEAIEEAAACIRYGKLEEAIVHIARIYDDFAGLPELFTRTIRNT